MNAYQRNLQALGLVPQCCSPPSPRSGSRCGGSRHHSSNHSRARGFTLVEVMVALIIIAIGMLGIAKMQALALASTGASRSRALAAIEASSLASAIHANRAYWSNAGAQPGTITITTSANSVSVAAPSTGTLQAALTTVQGTQCATTTNMTATLSCYCTSGNSTTCANNSYITMAANDLYDFAWTLGALLPSAQATITCNDIAVPVDCIIAIRWIENSVALNTNEAAATNSNTGSGTNAAFQTVGYTLYVVP